MATSIVLTSVFTLQKEDYESKKTLTVAEKKKVEDTLKTQGRLLIHKELKPVYNDYQHDFDRGTVEYTAKCRNYSHHKVIILDGTVVRNCNFTQKEPYTEAITGKNITFIDCNMTNNKKDLTWIYQDSGGVQTRSERVAEVDLGGGLKKVTISHKIEDENHKGTYIEVQRYDKEVDSDGYLQLTRRLNSAQAQSEVG